MRHQNNDEWEIAIGGNFLQIWEKDTYANMDILDFENGRVAEIELPNVRKLEIGYDDAINMVMPRAYLIARAPAMLRLLEEIAPLIEDEAERRESAPHSARQPEYWSEMREALDKIMVEIARAHGREVAEPAEAEAEDDEDNYDYAADDRNFDADRERRFFTR